VQRVRCAGRPARHLVPGVAPGGAPVTDLFGDERAEPVRPAAPRVQLDLLQTAADLAALASGRPVSQELALIRAPQPTPPEGGLF
jgi:hypothetical protein